MNAASMQISLNEAGPSLPELPGLLVTLINSSRRKEDAGKYPQLLLVPAKPRPGAAAEAPRPGEGGDGRSCGSAPPRAGRGCPRGVPSSAGA